MREISDLLCVCMPSWPSPVRAWIMQYRSFGYPSWLENFAAEKRHFLKMKLFTRHHQAQCAHFPRMLCHLCESSNKRFISSLFFQNQVMLKLSSVVYLENLLALVIYYCCFLGCSKILPTSYRTLSGNGCSWHTWCIPINPPPTRHGDHHWAR